MPSVGGTYEGHELICTVHGGYEMWHTCGGGDGEPLGYCSAWDGTIVDGNSTCRFEED